MSKMSKKIQSITWINSIYQTLQSIATSYTRDEPPDPGEAEIFYWGEEKGIQITKNIDECYDKIVYWTVP